jgi:uncharacterized protein (TIGR03437 family)
VTPSVPAGSAASTTTLAYTDSTVMATVGGINAQVLFSGLAPGWVGLYRVKVIVPAGVAPGSNVPLALTAAGAASVATTVAIK